MPVLDWIEVPPVFYCVVVFTLSRFLRFGHAGFLFWLPAVAQTRERLLTEANEEIRRSKNLMEGFKEGEWWC